MNMLSNEKVNFKSLEENIFKEMMMLIKKVNSIQIKVNSF